MFATLLLSMSVAMPMKEAPAHPIPDMGIIREEVVVEDVIDSEHSVDIEPQEARVDCVAYNIPNYSGRKSYMSCNLFGRNTKQYKLQAMATIDENGFCKVFDRYCIAVGSYFNVQIGQFVDLFLDNGVMIPCVIGDMKADQHTDETNMFSNNGCCSEFLVNTTKLNKDVKISGDVSSLRPDWKPQVKMIVTYDLNAFDLGGMYEVFY